VRCWSQQCPQDHVLAALGLARDDLLDQPGNDGQSGAEWTPPVRQIEDREEKAPVWIRSSSSGRAG
jgi:hypothetical protein